MNEGVKLTAFDIGKELKKTFNLDSRPLCIYGSDSVPLGALATTKFNQCIFDAIFRVALIPKFPSVYVGELDLRGLCFGGKQWLGFKKIKESLKNFVSHKKTKNGETGEFYMNSPEMVEHYFRSLGKITPPGKFINISPCQDLEDEDINPLTILLIGSPEKIRNISMLIYFSTDKFFDSVIMPFGSACVTMISFPSGMVENSPKDCAFIGPVDPTINSFFPRDLMMISIPINIAKRIVVDIPDSFAIKRKDVAFPKERTSYKKNNIFN